MADGPKAEPDSKLTADWFYNMERTLDRGRSVVLVLRCAALCCVVLCLCLCCVVLCFVVW